MYVYIHKLLKACGVSTKVKGVPMCIFPDGCAEFSPRLLHHAFMYHVMYS